MNNEDKLWFIDVVLWTIYIVLTTFLSMAIFKAMLDKPSVTITTEEYEQLILIKNSTNCHINDIINFDKNTTVSN